MNNIVTIKFRKDGSIEEMDDLRLFKLSNGTTIIRALSKCDPEMYNAYINFELPNNKQLNSRLMTRGETTQDGYFTYDYVMQAEELQYRGNLTMSITFEEKVV